MTWASRIDLATGRPVEVSGSRYDQSRSPVVWPSPVGAHSWQAMSYSPKTGLVYIPYMQLGARFTESRSASGAVSAGDPATALIAPGPDDGRGALLAWDPARERAAWRMPLPVLWNGGTLATAGNLIFQGSADGYLSAYEAASGRCLWRFNAGLGIIAAPISYAVGGRQYVSVLVGYGGSAAIVSQFMNVGWRFGTPPRRLLTFTLDGKAALPPSPPPDLTVHAVDDPSFRIDAAAVAAGRALYGVCGLCHGADLIAVGGPAPDLRASRIAANPDSLWAVLHDGVLLPNGMPRFETLTHEQVMDIYAYIRAGARAAVAAP